MIAVLFFSLVGLAGDSSGLELSGSVDLIGSAGSGSSQFQVREAELLLAAPVDHLFFGQFSAAAHQEGSQAFFEIHEAWISANALVPRMRARIGRFFLPVGRINQFHRHEWAFATTPLSQSNFFASEGTIDSGLDLAYLLPTPFFFEISGGVTAGYTFGHSHSAGSAPMVPTHFLRTAFFSDLPAKGGAQLGLNYVGRVSDVGERLTLLGIDVTGKWREGKTLGFLLQTEGWYRTLAGTREIAMYVYPQVGWTSGMTLGVRFDYLANLTLRDAGTSNWSEVYGPVLTYKPSEFSTLRLQYGFQRSILGSAASVSQLLTLQTVFQLGAHPAHDF